MQNAIIERFTGLIICRRPDRSEDDSPILYIISPPRYSEPRGGDFLVMCITAANRLCETSYIASGNYGITYDFWMPKKRPEAAADEIVAFDRRLRAAIEDMRVKDYVWPPQTPWEPAPAKGNN
jgi:hypothetical protein